MKQRSRQQKEIINIATEASLQMRQKLQFLKTRNLMQKV